MSNRCQEGLAGQECWLLFCGSRGADRNERMLSGLRSTRVIADESLDGFLVLGGCWWCWVWVVGFLYSGCLHLYFCVILFLVLLGRSVDALVLRADEGRGGLRYSSGS